jgi:hypothetical protein
MSAHTAAREPAARPPSPPDPPRSGSPTRAARHPPWGSSPGESRPGDTSHQAGRRATSGRTSTTARAVRRPFSPSGPGAPLFATTFFIAESSRSTTSSITAGGAFSGLTIAFGTPARPARDRSRAASRADPSGSSAVAIGSRSCPAVCSTGTAFPCPPTAGWTGITPPSGTTRSSDFCWAISRRYRRPTETRSEPNRSPRVSR